MAPLSSAYPCDMHWWQWTLSGLAITAAVWAACVGVLWVVGRRGDAAALARFVPDCVVLVKRLLGDERVSRWRKLILLPLLAYLALPIDLVPDFVPVAGQLDDAIVIGLALCVVLRGGDRALLRAHWPGPPESLAVVERFAFGAPRYAGARRERLTDEYRTQNRSVGTDPGSTHPSGRERETRSLSRIPGHSPP